ncbi:MAG TPA: hypothetical protein DCE81_01505, partial [Cytophagales bacterium]|nr:hypothetical protein [Cytophagales bacterium]
NDRTFCFWMNPETAAHYGLPELISHEWSKVIVGDNAAHEPKGLKYYYIQGIALYEKTRKLLRQHEAEIIHEGYDGVPRQHRHSCALTVKDKKILSGVVFDNRPPEYAFTPTSDVRLYQSFYGWVIHSEEEIFDSDCFTMMDFSVDQGGATQFMYVLPFNQKQALLECTRFGEKTISKDAAEEVLLGYLKNKQIDFSIESHEQGVIRMFSCPITNQSKESNWIDTGERAGCVKPSTGYSFVRNLNHADRIVQCLTNQAQVVRKLKNRYAYYDRLLLQILRDHPSKGKAIFTRLFSANRAETVFEFLDENTKPRDEISILGSLPIGLFAGAALKDFFRRSFNALRQLPIVLWITLLAIVLYQLKAEIVLYSMLGIGMLLFGIPHGALDHLHALENAGRKNLMAYILKYLGLGTLILILFWLSPALGLLIFLAYSAWHFGEADFSYWGFKNNVAAGLWGGYFLGALLLSHSKEVITLMRVMAVPVAMNQSFPDAWAMTWTIAVGSIFLVWKKQAVIFYGILTLILLQFLPIIPAFAIFFIAQHSFHGWTMLKRALPDSDMQLWKKALPFTLGAIVLSVLMGFFTEVSWGQGFIFFAALGFPHVVLMYQLEKKLR